MIRTHFEIGETAVAIIAEERFVPVAEASIFRSREVIQRFIRRDPLFQLTLEPYEPPDDAHPLVRRMCSTSQMAGVGPMATVAGAIAEQAVVEMQKAGADHAVIDNGGDIAMLLKESVNISLYAGDSFVGLGFRCEPREGMFGMCTSSATIGPSLSFGATDASTVLSSNVALADACATRLGNLVNCDDDEVISGALNEVCSIPGVEGALVVVGGKIARKGRLPPLIRMECDPSKVAKIEL